MALPAIPHANWLMFAPAARASRLLREQVCVHARGKSTQSRSRSYSGPFNIPLGYQR